jgi:predicted DNA-binding transcriptional regulator AlpA
MNALQETGFLRLSQIIGDAKRGIPPLIPVASSTWWQGVKAGKYPEPVRFGGRITAWRAEDIRRFIETGYVQQEETK